MAYTVKLKNQAGIDVNYSDIETLTIPMASGSGNAVFMARYAVTKYAASNITYNGGDYAANGVDYLCVITTGETGKLVPDKIKVTIGGNTAEANLAYSYSKMTGNYSVVRVNGAYVTGDIVVEAVAVTA